MNESRSIFFQHLTDQLRMARNIKIEGTFVENENRLRKNFTDYFKISLSYLKFINVLSSVNATINILFKGVLMVFSAIQIIEGNMTIGQFTVVNSYFSSVISGIKYYLDIATNYQKIKSSLIRVNELQDIEPESNGTIILNDISSIKVNSIYYKYDDFSESILQGLNCVFEKGKIYLIKGTNGAGKSTFINILIGLIQEVPYGSVEYNDTHINFIDLYNSRLKNMCILPQKIVLSNIHVSDLIQEVYKFHEDENLYNCIVEKKLDKLFLNSEFNIFNYLNKTTGELSGGELQKVAILRTLLKDSEVIILDEPTSALDNNTTELFKLALTNISENKIIIIITHDHSFKDIANEIIQFNRSA